MKGLLASILASKGREVEQLKERAPMLHVANGPRGNVASSLRRGAGEPMRLIAENKRKSPSAGALSTALSAGDRAVHYAQAGAAMVSILCDEPFFGGSWADITAARLALVEAGYAIPLLAKEFVIDERQLLEACACGADAVLLIARIVEPEHLRKLLDCASSLGLESLVEVVTHDELERAVVAGATLIGVNARDLDTLQMDTARAAQVLEAIPDTCIPLYLSGLKTPDDVGRLAGTHVHAALIGETLMREDDPRERLGALVRAATRAGPPDRRL